MTGRPPLELRFNLGPIPVAIEPGFWLMTGLLGLASGTPWGVLIWIGIVLFSVLIHELGHALTSLAFGNKAAIRLYAFGGLTYPAQRLSRGREVVMALAGPAAGFVVGGLLMAVSRLVAPSQPLAKEALEQALWVNIGWGVFNLLPVLPLDGGHVLIGVLGPKRQRAALLVGAILGAGVAVAGAITRQLWLGLLFGMLGWRNLQAFLQMGKPPPAEQATPLLVEDVLAEGWDALRKGDEATAYRNGQLVAERSGDPETRNRGRDLLAWVAMARSDHRDALKQLERSEPPEAARAVTWAMVLDSLGEVEQAAPYALRAVEVEPSDTAAALAARLTAKAGHDAEAQAIVARFGWSRPAAKESALGEVELAQRRFERAAMHFGAAFELGGAARDAYDTARSHARAGARPEALRWIERAIKAGFDDLGQLHTDPDFATLRGDPELERVLAAIPKA